MSNWEKCVIGTVLNDPAAMQEAADLLPSDFTGSNVIAWAEILALHNRQSLGVRSFTEALRASPDFRRTSDTGTPEEYVRDCSNYRGQEIKEYVSRVLEESTRRALTRSTALINAAVQQEGASADELLDYAEKQILNLRRSRMDLGVTMADLMALFMPRLQAMREGTFRPAWTPDTLAVKEIIQFAEKSDFIIVAGRPGDGKSSYMRYEFRRHVGRGGKAVIFNLENDNIEYARNFLSLETGIDSERLKTGRDLTEADLELIRQAADALARMPLRVINASGWSVQQITRAARKLISESGYDLIGVDYLQLVSNGLENKVQDVSMTSQTLKAFNGQMQVPVMAAAQLSRAIETRSNQGENGDPKLSDLRDSGSIEQDGSIIMFPRNTWRNPSEDDMRIFPENINPNTRVLFPNPKAVPMRMHILKNRNGQIGTSTPIKWIKSTGRYQTLEVRR